MLYNPKWDGDLIHDGVSLRALIAWLETQDPQEQYHFTYPHDCALAQFMQAQGIPRHLSSVDLPYNDADPGRWLTHIAQGSGGYREQTFGAALQRARATQTAGQGE